MLQDAALSFAGMILTSLAGFGGLLETAVMPTKAFAVAFLVLFFVTLYRVLSDAQPAQSPHS